MSAMPQCGHLGLLMSRRKDDSEVAMDTACWAGRSDVPLMATRSSRLLGPSPGSKAPDVSSSPGPIRSRTAPQFAPRNGTHGGNVGGRFTSNQPTSPGPDHLVEAGKPRALPRLEVLGQSWMDSNRPSGCVYGSR